MSNTGQRGFVNILQEFSVPLIAGVFAALVFANADYATYHAIVEFGPFDGLCANAEPGGLCIQPEAPSVETEGYSDHGEIKPVLGIFGHHVTIHFLINDIFMLFFFGIAAKEITESLLPGGALSPPTKAINPLLATVGGIVGPVSVYLALGAVLYAGSPDLAAVQRGWGVPTATDIALAWLVARVVFGASHPAVNFLLLLAIADDAIGLIIIAVFYGDPEHPARPAFLLLLVAGMAVAWFLRRRGTRSWIPYVFIAGTLSWLGLLLAYLHPALALVPIIPFLPGPSRDTGLFSDRDEVDQKLQEAEISGASPAQAPGQHSPLHVFEHDMKLFVDFGLFFFGFANAGVTFGSMNNLTWIVLAALVVGKTAGVTLFSVAGRALGFGFPTGMNVRHILVAGMIAAIGLTVALFVAGEAFPQPQWQGPAKMGALLSSFAAVLAYVAGKAWRVKELESPPTSPSESPESPKHQLSPR